MYGCERIGVSRMILGIFDCGPTSDMQKDASRVRVMPQEETTLVSHEASLNEQLGDPVPDGQDVSEVTSDRSEGWWYLLPGIMSFFLYIRVMVYLLGHTWGYTVTEVENMRQAVESPDCE